MMWPFGLIKPRTACLKAAGRTRPRDAIAVWS